MSRDSPDLAAASGIPSPGFRARMHDAPNRRNPPPYSPLHRPRFPPDNPADPATLYSSDDTRPPSSPAVSHSRSTLLWANLEPWMDEEYAKQVCALMGWDPVSIKVPQPTTGQQTNNPGYCFLTFSSPAHAASVLTQIKGTMPNSAKPFSLNWAPALPPAVTASLGPSTPAPQYQREHSIFVGDLAPETSNSDLVAVFRNPVLGLRNDREPKFIRPFLSCKSAKIMLDPVTGVSRGYGFVRFTDEADQQRALIEMHGLYCLSRPMRISPATAKFKPPPSTDVGQPSSDSPPATLPTGPQPKSVSAPIAATNSNSSLGTASSSNNSMGGSSSGGSLSSTLPQGYNDPRLGNPSGVPSLLSEAQLRQVLAQNDPYPINEESWKHHAQARAILGNLIGPNGEQLTSTDPYNTTVFVGGLSPLISEETLRTFFTPFGDIHYVKVPVGKHCGFVQFVRKADAERAIEKMQGFPIGGSRIRLSWGRSQYKAAQAAAQAAQTAALQAQYTAPTIPAPNAMTPDQALQLLYKLSRQGYLSPGPGDAPNDLVDDGSTLMTNHHLASSLGSDNNNATKGSDTPQNLDAFSSNGLMPRPDIQRALSNFSPFSPDPNTFIEENSHAPRESFSTYYPPGFYLHQLQTQDLKMANDVPPPAQTHGKLSPGAPSRYGYHGHHDRTISRSDPSSRPSSGHQLLSSIINHDRLEADRDDLEDLNGTLASLDLDRSWHQSPEVGNDKNGNGSFAYGHYHQHYHGPISGTGKPSSPK